MANVDALVIPIIDPPMCEAGRKERRLLDKFSFKHYQHCIRRYMKRRKRCASN
jgi:hypothetical protein